MMTSAKKHQFNAQREWVMPQVLTCKYCRRIIHTDPDDPDGESYFQKGFAAQGGAWHMRCYNRRHNSGATQ